MQPGFYYYLNTVEKQCIETNSYCQINLNLSNSLQEKGPLVKGGCQRS